MGWPQIWGLLRHLLTTAGGWAVTMGWFTDSDVTTLVGAIGVLGGMIWSFVAPEKKAVTP